MADQATTAQATTNAAAPNTTATETPEQLHDAAIVATEAWQNEADETKRETLKETAKQAAAKAKESFKSYTKAQKEASDKAAQELAAKNKVPEKYELKLPEGSKLNATHLEKVAAFAKSKGLTQEQAQLHLERRAQAIAEFEKETLEMFDNEQKNWKAISEADKEFGGEAFKANAELVKRVVDKYGSDEFKKLLSSGYGNHPEVNRFILRIGKQMSEDQLVIPGAQTGADKKEMSDLFYGAPKEQTQT